MSKLTLDIRYKYLVLVALWVVLLPARAQESDYLSRANALAKKYLLVDTHIDVPYRLQNQWENVAIATKQGDFDLPRANAGGLNAAFMSIYIPANYEVDKGAIALADSLIDRVEAIVARAPKHFALAYSVGDVLSNFKSGKISLPLGMENGTPIGGDLKNLKHFYDRGIRYITLAHSKTNHISDSSYDKNRVWNGLSPFGKKMIEDMNRLGIMVDISHVSDEAFFDTLKISKAPIIASHSSARQFTPGFERNMSDKMIKALAKNSGLIMINFGSTFITKTANEYSIRFNAAKEAFKKSYQIDDNHPKLKEFNKIYQEENPFPYADVKDVVDHIHHIVKLVGVDHVGIGSDYDGVGDSLPTNLKDVSAYPSLIAELLKRGYKEKDIEKILGKNLIRVWAAVEKHAGSLK